MQEFSFEKFKEAKQKTGLSHSAIADIKTTEKILARGPDLFTEHDKNELRNLEDRFPTEYQFVRDTEPFYDLTPEQQEQVLNDFKRDIEKEGMEAFIKQRTNGRGLRKVENVTEEV